MEEEVSVGEVRDYGQTQPQNRTRNPSGQDQSSTYGQISQPAGTLHCSIVEYVWAVMGKVVMKYMTFFCLVGS